MGPISPASSLALTTLMPGCDSAQNIGVLTRISASSCSNWRSAGSWLASRRAGKPHAGQVRRSGSGGGVGRPGNEALQVRDWTHLLFAHPGRHAVDTCLADGRGGAGARARRATGRVHRSSSGNRPRSPAGSVRDAGESGIATWPVSRPDRVDAARAIANADRSRPRRVPESKAVDGGAKNAFQVMVVGLESPCWQAVVPRGEGMNQPRFAAGLAEGPLHGPMIRAGHFDGDDVVPQAVFSHASRSCRVATCNAVRWCSTMVGGISTLP